MRRWLLDIRFWIVVFFLIRLINIDLPLVDSHEWRQADGYSVARNFYNINDDIRYPRVDHFKHWESGTGISGSEFPIMNYMVSWSYHFTEVGYWQGRLLNLIFSCIGLYFFFSILKDHFQFKKAFEASVIVLFSLFFIHSRKFMPDVFSISLVLIGAWFLINYIRLIKKWHLIPGILFIAVGVLAKISAGIVLAFLIPFYLENPLKKERVVSAILLLLSLCMVGYWYFIWVDHLNGIDDREYYYMGTSIGASIKSIYSRFGAFFMQFVYGLNFIAFGLFVFGIFLQRKFKLDRKLWWAIFFAKIGMILFILRAGDTFINLSYYVLPLVPFMAIVAANSLDVFRKSWMIYIVLGAIGLESVLSNLHQFRNQHKDDYKIELGKEIDNYMESDALICTNGNLNPKQLYYLNRRGWLAAQKDVLNPSILELLKKNGCKYIVWDKNESGLSLNFDKVYEDTNFIIYKM